MRIVVPEVMVCAELPEKSTIVLISFVVSFHIPLPLVICGTEPERDEETVKVKNLVAEGRLVMSAVINRGEVVAVFMKSIPPLPVFVN